MYDVNEVNYSTCGQDANPPPWPQVPYSIFYKLFLQYLQHLYLPRWTGTLNCFFSVGNRSSIGKVVATFSMHKQLQNLPLRVHFKAFRDSFIYSCLFLFPIASNWGPPFWYMTVENSTCLLVLSPLRGLFPLFCSPEASLTLTLLTVSWVVGSPQGLACPWPHFTLYPHMQLAETKSFLTAFKYV